MELISYDLRTKEGEAQIIAWAQAGHDMRQCPELQTALSVYLRLRDNFNTARQAVADQMVTIGSTRVGHIVQYLQGMAPHATQSEIREGFEPDTLCNFYRSVMALSFGTADTPIVDKLMPKGVVTQVQKAALAILNHDTAESMDPVLLSVTIDAMVDVVRGLQERAKSPYVSKEQLASAHQWKVLRNAHRYVRGQDDGERPAGLSYDATVGQSLGFQVHCVIHK